MKTKNEIIIDGVHHVLVPDSNTSCKIICTDICSLRRECTKCVSCAGIHVCICSLIMKEPASHFEIKKRKVYTKKNTHETTKRDNN